MYDVHPRWLVARRNGRWNNIGSDRDPVTGKTASVMEIRRSDNYDSNGHERTQRERCNILNDILRHGAQWERHIMQLSTHVDAYRSLNDKHDMEKQLRRLAFDHHDPPEAPVVGQRVVHDSTLGLPYVATVRTPSSKKKTQKTRCSRY